MSKKYIKWFMILALIVPMFLVACGGSTEDAVDDAVDTVEETADDVAADVEEAADEVADTAEEAMDDAEATAEEAMDDAEEAVADAEEAMEEEAMDEPCAPAADGPLAGVDPADKPLFGGTTTAAAVKKCSSRSSMTSTKQTNVASPSNR